jgi:tRNA(Ile)-lysidine synthase
MDLITRVRSFIRQHDLIRPESRVALAVSGGSDSMALLHVLGALSRGGALRIAGVVHFNHQLRPTALTHERFVAAAAAACGIPFVSGREDVAARRARERCSIEQAARHARYEFFERGRAELGADVIALGHTRDDQAETLLLRLLRGAGPRGLAGMHPRHGSVVRPLLDCRRTELRDWLNDQPTDVSPPYLDDETNDDVSIPRNRVRHELVPLLTERFNPAIVDVLAREAGLLRELWTWMDETSAPLLVEAGTLDVAQLRRAPAALQRLVIWRALTEAADGREISFDHVAAIVRLIQQDESAREKSVDVPAVQVQRIGGRVVLKTRRSTATRGSNDSRGSASENLENPQNPQNPLNPMNLLNPLNPDFSYLLSIPGSVLIPEAGCVISAESPPGAAEPEQGAAVGNGVVAAVRRDQLGQSLVVRNRRPGDRFRPVGLCGSKKIQDLFVDRKVPRAERDGIPLVLDESGRIVWVAGHGIDDAFRVTDPSQAVLVLRLTRASHGGAPE